MLLGEMKIGYGMVGFSFEVFKFSENASMR